MTNQLGYAIEQIAILLKKIFQFFINIFYTNGHLNIFGYLIMVMISLILLTTIIEIIVKFLND